MNILIALAVTVSTYIVQTDYCHRWATSEIQAVAISCVESLFAAVKVELTFACVIPVTAALSGGVAVSVNLRRPRDYLIR